MQPKPKSQPTGSVLTRITYFLKAAYIFFPGILFLLLGLFTFLKLPQGKDIIYQSTDGANSWVTGLYLVLATIFWVFTTWFTARFIAYNRNDMYERAPWVLYHFPRLLGFSIFLVLGLAVFLIDDVTRALNKYVWLIVIGDFLVYIFFHAWLETSLHGDITATRWKRLNLIRNLVRVLIIISCALVIIKWQQNHVTVLLYTLPIFQVGFLFLVIVRHPLYKCNPQRDKRSKIPGTTKLDRYIHWVYSEAFDDFDEKFEKPIFIVYHVLAFFAMLFYLLSINYLPFARELSSFPLVLLAFGILLGIINFIALVSHRKNINLNFIVLFIIVVFGFFFESHPVRLKDTGLKGNAYTQRPDFRAYLQQWISWHQAEIDSSEQYAVFFTLADGGASRSGYWAASVLGNLHEKTRYDQQNSNHSYFTDHLFCMSGASGGSVGNASFLAALKIQQKYPDVLVDSLCTRYLDNDFLVYPLARLLGPDLIKPVFGFWKGWGDRAAALEIGMEYPGDREGAMAQVLRNDFGQLIPNDNNHLPLICINTTRVDDGRPGVVSNFLLADSIFSKRLDVAAMVPEGKQIRISTAMVLGARFPYMSPGGKLGDSYFVDGGYFDNSGAGVVHEMLLELNHIANDSLDSLHPIVKKFQFYVLHLSNSPTPQARSESNHDIHPFVNDLATPLLTLAGSYNSQTSINDLRLKKYLEEINNERTSYHIFNLYRKDTVESISMNWVISNRSRNLMSDRVKHKPSLIELENRLNSGRKEDLLGRLPQDR